MSGPDRGAVVRPEHAGGHTQLLADWASGVEADRLPEAVRHQVRRIVLDYLGAAVAGSESQPARAVRDYLAESGDRGSATVIGADFGLPPASAALANGTAAHALEVDDGYTPGASHPGAPVVAAVLAAAEATGAGGDELLAAISVGIEISCRIAEAGHPATWRRGFHNTSLAGVFGAAAGVARLHGAGSDEMANAFGVAGSHAGGLFEFLGQGADVKRLHAGMAARNGLVSAELARHGLTGPSTVLEGPRGYFAAFAGGDADLAGLVADLGTDWRMLRTYVKPYPCCRHLHGPIDAVLEMADRSAIEPDDVDRIVVGTYSAAAQHDKRSVGTLLDAQLSIPHAVAVAVVHGRPRLEHFRRDLPEDPRVRRLRSLTEVEVDDNCARDYPSMRPARVTIHTSRTHQSVRVDHPLGEPANPMDDEGLERKVRDLVTPVLGAERTGRLVGAAWKLSGITDMMDQLRAGSAPRATPVRSTTRLEQPWN